MTDNWTPKETTTHQDHVIAHVLGATVLGYFVFDETLYILLDIGFVWIIFLDGEMALLPHPVATAELQVNEQTRKEVQADVDSLLAHKLANGLMHVIQLGVECVIKDVGFFANDEERRLVLTGEEASLTIDTSLETAEICVYEF